MAAYIPNIEIHILMGLPGSGKSYYATHNYNTQKMWRHDGTCILDLDKHRSEDLIETIYNAAEDTDLKSLLNELWGYYEYIKICVDGLITKKSQLQIITNNVVEYIRNHWKYTVDIKVVVHYWNEDRETCLHNDKMRMKSGDRNESAALSIKNLEYDHIYLENIKALKNINEYVTQAKLVKHTVKKATNYDVLLERLIGEDVKSHTGAWSGGDLNGKSKYMYSESWSGGGTWGNCWGDEGDIGVEEGKEFNELDNLLEKICPNITFLQYKKIRSECVSMDEHYDHDYYGGRELILRWKCDVEKLYELLKEMNLMDDYS